jgi:osmoprotectant transport system permease protein
LRPLSIQFRLGIVLAAVLLMGALLLLGRRHMPAGGLQASFDAEFFTRPDGYSALTQYYGLHFTKPPIQMDPGLKYRALADGLVDVIDGYTTDGRIPAYGLVILEDDKHFFPPYDAAPLVSERTLARHPSLRELLNELGGRIDNQRMQQMNFRVDQSGEKAQAVARAFLLEEGLITPEAKPPAPGSERVVMGGKPFTEQEILGEIMAQLIEARAGLAVDRKFNLGGTLICFEALRAGGIDLYPEYTGTALMTILHHERVTDPRQAQDLVRREFKEKWNLIWLEPFGLNDSYSLTMRHAQAEALGIRSISDLAVYLDRQNQKAKAKQ